MLTRTRYLLWRTRLLIYALLIVVFGSCELTMEAPHLVMEESLDDPKAIPAILAGVRGDFAFATASATGGVYLAGAMLTDEVVHTGTFLGFRNASDGLTKYDDVEANTWWSQMSRARWVAENAAQKIEKWYADGAMTKAVHDTALARASLYAGFANRVLGDNFEDAVIDGGPRQARTVYYDRALTYFNKALSVVAETTPVGQAAIGGRAQVNMNLRKWSEAVTDAAKIPTTFAYNQIHAASPSREQNMFAWWVHLREENSVWGTPFAAWGRNRTPTSPGALPTTDGDPRVEYDIPVVAGAARLGGDFRRPFWRQWKYPGTGGYAMPIPIVKGTEMQLIRAEERLIAGDVAGMVARINEVRARARVLFPTFATHASIADLVVATVTAMTPAARWELLMRERGIEMWLEGRRLGDLRRWATTPGTTMVPFTVVREIAVGQPATADPRRNVITSATPLHLVVGKHEYDSNKNLPRP